VILDGLYIRNLDGILTKTRLTELSVASCENMLNFEQIWQLSTLKRLNLRSTKIESLDGIQKLNNLQNLDISYCYKLKTIKPVFALKRLKELFLGNRIKANIFQPSNLYMINYELESLAGFEEIAHNAVSLVLSECK
jgi:Leucine-rich repeat (LRR) protein